MKKYYWGIGAALLCIFWGTGCTRPVQETPASGFASVRNEILVDSLGRELVLNGINHVTKSPMMNSFSKNSATGESTASAMASTGTVWNRNRDNTMKAISRKLTGESVGQKKTVSILFWICIRICSDENSETVLRNGLRLTNPCLMQRERSGATPI